MDISVHRVASLLKSKIDKKENKRLWMNWTVQQLFKGYKNVLIIILLFVRLNLCRELARINDIMQT